MMKTILKWFTPSSDTISDMIVDQVSEMVNTSDKTDLIVKYAGMFDRWQNIQSILVKTIKDGKIDDTEKDELKKVITPIVDKVLQEIFK